MCVCFACGLDGATGRALNITSMRSFLERSYIKYSSSSGSCFIRINDSVTLAAMWHSYFIYTYRSHWVRGVQLHIISLHDYVLKPVSLSLLRAYACVCACVCVCIMCAWLLVSVCVHLHTHLHTQYMCIYTYTQRSHCWCPFVYMYKYTYIVYGDVYRDVHKRTTTVTYVYGDVCICINTHIYTCVRSYIHIYTHTHTHTRERTVCIFVHNWITHTDTYTAI